MPKWKDRSAFQPRQDVFCIDHCREGRLEYPVGKDAYSYVEAVFSQAYLEFVKLLCYTNSKRMVGCYRRNTDMKMTEQQHNERKREIMEKCFECYAENGLTGTRIQALGTV